MPRPDRSVERRLEFVPILARTFAELGFRRTTTAELAGRCDVRENILYRLWSDKRAMFIASLEYVYSNSEALWNELLAQAPPGASPAQVVLDYEAQHHGEFGLYRIVFAGLSETDDPEIAAALKRLYRRFQAFVKRQVVAHLGLASGGAGVDAGQVAWAILGLGTVASITRELSLLTGPARGRLVSDMGRALLGPR